MTGIAVVAFAVVAAFLAVAAVFTLQRWQVRSNMAPNTAPNAAPPAASPAASASAGRPSAASSPRSSDRSTGGPDERPADRPAAPGAPLLAAIPAACGVLPAALVRRLVPTDAPRIERMGAETAGVCKYSYSEGPRYRAVQIDTRAFLPKYLHDQAIGMTVWSFEAQYRQAQKDRTADTWSLRRVGGLGDAAFERYWIDRDIKIAVGEATVRYRNAVLRVQYSEGQPPARGRSASERHCLAEAIAAARAGLASFH